MVHVQRSFTVPAPLTVALDYMKDFHNAEQWDPGTITCDRIDSGPIAVGSSWRNVSEFRGSKTELTYTIRTLEADRVVFEGRNKTATSIDDIHFHSNSDGSTVVTYTADITFHGLAKLADPFMKKEFEKLGDGVVTGVTRHLTPKT